MDNDVTSLSSGSFSTPTNITISSTATSTTSNTNSQTMDAKLALEVILDPIQCVAVWGLPVERGVVSRTSSKRVTASSEDILTPSTRRDFHGNKSSQFSPDLLAPDTIKTSYYDGKRIQKARVLWIDIIDHLYDSLLCTKCFFGHELVSVLQMYLQTVTETVVHCNNVKLVSSRLLVSGVVKDARKENCSEFRESRLYRFSSNYVHIHRIGFANISDNQTRQASGIRLNFSTSCKTTLQSLATTVKSWKRTRTSSESDKDPPQAAPKTAWNHQTISPLSLNPLNINPPSLHVTTQHKQSLAPCNNNNNNNNNNNTDKQLDYQIFNPKGYPEVKIPHHVPKTKPPLPPKSHRDRNNSSSSSKQPTLKRSSSFSSLTSVAVDRDSNKSCSTCDNNNPWVVYGYL